MATGTRETLPTGLVSTPAAKAATKECRHAVILAKAILGVDLNGALAGIADQAVQADSLDIARIIVLADAQRRLLALQVAGEEGGDRGSGARSPAHPDAGAARDAGGLRSGAPGSA